MSNDMYPEAEGLCLLEMDGYLKELEADSHHHSFSEL